MDKKKLEAFVHHILQECEKEGLSISEVERLPQALQFAISDSVAAQIKNINFRSQIPSLQESSDSDDCNH